MKKKILFIINPISGWRNKFFIEKKILTTLSLDLFLPSFKTTKNRGDAAIFAKEAVVKKFYCVVAVGGDGTINEISSALISSSTKLGIIPMGSGNGFASYFKIYSNLTNSVKILNKLNHTKIDACFINKKLFLNLAGLGFSSKIARKTHSFKKRGVWIYFINIFKEFFHYTSKTYTLVIDKNKRIIKEFFILEFANASIWGKGVNIAPLANPSDGKIEVCGVTSFHFWEVPYLLFLSITKGINKSAYYVRFEAKEVEVLSSHSTAHVDGESINIKSPIKVTIKKNAISLLVPK